MMYATETGVTSPGQTFSYQATLHGAASCDFNQDGVLGMDDINELTLLVATTGSTDDTFDVNHDGLVNVNDISHWVQYCFESYIGDADLDHEFDSDDLITVAAALTYEADVAAVWTTGDWNGSGRFDSADLIDAAADLGYEVGPRAMVVPEVEATALWSVSLALVTMCARARRRSFVLPTMRKGTSGHRNPLRVQFKS